MERFVVDAVSGWDFPFGCKSPIQGDLYRWAALTVFVKDPARWGFRFLKYDLFIFILSSVGFKTNNFSFTGGWKWDSFSSKIPISSCHLCPPPPFLGDSVNPVFYSLTKCQLPLSVCVPVLSFSTVGCMGTVGRMWRDLWSGTGSTREIKWWPRLSKWNRLEVLSRTILKWYVDLWALTH